MTHLDRYIAAILRFRWLVIALAVLIMLITGAGMRFITVAHDYRILFSEKNPHLLAFDALENTYSASNNALIAACARERDRCSPNEALSALEELTKAAWKTPYSSRVDSLTNYTHSRAEDDDLIVEPLVDDVSVLNDADLARIRKIALNATEIVGRLVSRDGRVGGLAITFVLPENQGRRGDRDYRLSERRFEEGACQPPGHELLHDRLRCHQPGFCRCPTGRKQDTGADCVSRRRESHDYSPAFGFRHSGHRSRSPVRHYQHHGVRWLGRRRVQPPPTPACRSSSW